MSNSIAGPYTGFVAMRPDQGEPIAHSAASSQGPSIAASGSCSRSEANRNASDCSRTVSGICASSGGRSADSSTRVAMPTARAAASTPAVRPWLSGGASVTRWSEAFSGGVAVEQVLDVVALRREPRGLADLQRALARRHGRRSLAGQHEQALGLFDRHGIRDRRPRASGIRPSTRSVRAGPTANASRASCTSAAV